LLRAILPPVWGRGWSAAIGAVYRSPLDPGGFVSIALPTRRRSGASSAGWLLEPSGLPRRSKRCACAGAGRRVRHHKCVKMCWGGGSAGRIDCVADGCAIKYSVCGPAREPARYATSSAGCRPKSSYRFAYGGIAVGRKKQTLYVLVWALSLIHISEPTRPY